MSQDLYAFRRETKALVGPTTQLGLIYRGRKYTTFNGGDISLEIHVPGYWGGETVRMKWEAEDKRPEIRYVSGGYERDFDDIARARNFGMAMMFAAEVAQNWVSSGWAQAFCCEFSLADEKISPEAA